MRKSLKILINILCINILSVICLLITFNVANGQLVDYGQNPPGLKWKQMETPHFQVIFPEVLLGEARRTAEILEYFRPYESSPLRDFPEKTPILLQNQTVISNGRSEEHTSELQSLLRISYAVFCLKKKN